MCVACTDIEDRARVDRSIAIAEFWLAIECFVVVANGTLCVAAAMHVHPWPELEARALLV